VTLQHLATWGLGPKPSTEVITHEFTIRRREFLFYLEVIQFLYIP